MKARLDMPWRLTFNEPQKLRGLCATMAIACFWTASTHADDNVSSHVVHMDVAAQHNENLQIVPVRYGTLSATLRAMAQVEVNAGHSVTIRPAGDGKVLQVLVTPGQTVRRNQTLITYIDHSLHVLALQEQQARAGLGAAQAASTEAQQAYQRGVELSGDAVAAGEVKRRRAVLQESRDTVISREADVGTIEHRLREEFNSPTERIVHEEESALISPVDGVVQSMNTGVASDIGPADTVARVVDLSTVWIVAEIRPEEASQVAIGSTLRVRPAGDPKAPVIAATIDTIDGVANPATGLIRVVSVVRADTGNLRPGTMLDAALNTTRAQRGLLVPLAALQRLDGQEVVFVRTASNAFEPRPVQIGLQTDDAAVVTGNLALGDPIATEGSFALKSVATLSNSTSN